MFIVETVQKYRKNTGDALKSLLKMKAITIKYLELPS